MLVYQRVITSTIHLICWTIRTFLSQHKAAPVREASYKVVRPSYKHHKPNSSSRYKLISLSMGHHLVSTIPSLSSCGTKNAVVTDFINHPHSTIFAGIATIPMIGLYIYKYYIL